MRNNRSIGSVTALAEHHDIATTPPPKDSLFFKLWNECENIAQEALTTEFIQGIATGTLDPTIYGGFNVADAYYCFNGAGEYQTAADRAQVMALKEFLTQKYQGYEKYTASLATDWHVANPASVVSTGVIEYYSLFEREVATHHDPIYSLIVMIPCEYLWAWLARQMAPPSPNNLYASWITENDDPSAAYAMGNFLEQYHQCHMIDYEKALTVYEVAMGFEKDNFAASTERPAANLGGPKSATFAEPDFSGQPSRWSSYGGAC